MSLLYIEGFEQYNISDDIVDGHTPWLHGDNDSAIDQGGLSNTYARGGEGKGLRITYIYAGSSWPTFTWQNPVPGASLILGYATKGVDTVPTTSSKLVAFVSEDEGKEHFYLKVEADLSLALYTHAGGDSTPVVSTTTKFPLEIWNYLEVRGTINASSGNIEVRLFGETVLSYTGDTKHADSVDSFVHWVHFGAHYRTETWYDDMYFADFQGPTNNDFLGDIYIRALSPDADGSANDFTSSDAPTVTTRYTQVDEGPPHDGDGTYIDAENNGDQQLFDYPNAATLGDVGGVMSFSYAKKDGAGSIGLKKICKSGTTTEKSDNQALTSDYVPTWAVFDVDPDTGVAWTTAGLNAAEFGVEVVKA